MQTIIGFDLDHSSIKIETAAGKRTASLLMPSHACPAAVIVDDIEAEKARRETVTLDGRDGFSGSTALLQGRHLPTGFPDGWIHTPEHTAQFLGGSKALKKHWPNTSMSHNARFSVANGYGRFGLGTVNWVERREAAQVAEELA